jgi:hypothetical protein
VWHCDPCHKNRKSFLQLDKRKQDQLLQNDNQLLQGLKQEGSSTRPYTTMTPQTAKNRLRANAVGCKSMKKQISYLKKKLKADTKTMKILANDSSIRELVVNVSGIILDEKWNAKEAIIDSLLEVEGEGELGKSTIRSARTLQSIY